MSSHIRITDVSPRDGLQNEPGVIPLADKLRLVELLSVTGVDEVEVTSFVSPTWVPQLGDAEALMKLVREFRDGVMYVSGSIPARTNRPSGVLPVYSVLVPNEKGFERALAVHEGGMPLKIAVFTAASESFNMKNTNATIDASLGRFRTFLPRAFKEGMDVRMYVSCAVACPFEGAIAPAAVRRVVDALLALAPNDAIRSRLDIDLGDTIGIAHPHEIETLLKAFPASLRETQLTLHLHDTFGRAAACIRTALDLGVKSFDGAAGGLGGCPYASTPGKRAPGNISTELLVRTIHEAGYSTTVDPDHLAEVSAVARDMVGR